VGGGSFIIRYGALCISRLALVLLGGGMAVVIPMHRQRLVIADSLRP
jgi:hypothetical protein